MWTPGYMYPSSFIFIRAPSLLRYGLIKLWLCKYSIWVAVQLVKNMAMIWNVSYTNKENVNPSQSWISKTKPNI